MKFNLIVKEIRKILKKDIVIDINDKISSLGLSSMQMVQLAVVLDEICNVEITPDVMSKIITVKDLIDLQG